jgi:hypothetical protein
MYPKHVIFIEKIFGRFNSCIQTFYFVRSKMQNILKENIKIYKYNEFAFTKQCFLCANFFMMDCNIRPELTCIKFREL